MKPQDYTIGWISALPLEKTAAMAMLDERHDGLAQNSNDPNNYTFGRMGVHNLVIACLPAGELGVASAAIVANRMRSIFPWLRFGLMVGIAGGAPSDKVDLRLGDVVVSQPMDTSGGVLQFDFGKALPDGQFLRTGALNRPPPVLCTAVASLQAEHSLGDSKMPHSYPGANLDEWFDPDYKHVPGSACSNCDRSRLVRRSDRRGTDPAISYGLIASGNEVMRDGVTRERLRKECFEMEAAGLMNNFPCLVVRGICDYADSHKNKRWQPYAAATAAAYAKEVLSVVPRDQVECTESIALLLPPPESVDVVRIPIVSRAYLFAIAENKHYQDYYHEATVLPASTPNRPGLVTHQEIKDLRKSTDKTSQMENKLDKLMHNYRDNMISYIGLFPNAQQQRAVFSMMVAAASGSIVKDDETGRTLLHYMAMNGVADILEGLTDAGFDVNAKDSDGRTPLHLAIIGNHADAVEVLVERCHADVNLGDMNRTQPWYQALAIDNDNFHELPARFESKIRIIRLLSQYVDPDKIRNPKAKKILCAMKATPDALIELQDTSVRVAES